MTDTECRSTEQSNSSLQFIVHSSRCLHFACRLPIAIIVLMTAARMEEATRLADMLVGANLAACVQILPQMESVYRWKGKIERQAEVLLIAKTLRSRFAELERRSERDPQLRNPGDRCHCQRVLCLHPTAMACEQRSTRQRLDSQNQAKILTRFEFAVFVRYGSCRERATSFDCRSGS